MDTKDIFNILFGLVGGLGIFLLGMKHMSEGMQAIAGSRLRRMIGLVTDNRFLAVGVGCLVTCMVQSSSVTSVMVVGLVNSGFMLLKQAIGVVLGANIGTTITGWILVLKIGKYGLPLLGISAFFFLFSKNEKVRYTGMCLMGIGMVFFGLELMKNGLKPIRSSEEFLAWFHAFQATSYLGVLKCALVGCLLTCIVQSSSATLGITMSLASEGIIPFETAAALVLGENIGTTITAYLASLGASTNAKRAAYSHALFNLLGVAWITAIFPFYITLVVKVTGGHDPNLMVLQDGVATYPHIMSNIAATHTIFNVLNTILFVGLLGPLAWIVTKIAPDKRAKESHHLEYLDVRMLDTPSMGIAQSRKEVAFMGTSVDKMLGMLRTLIAQDNHDLSVEKLQQKIFHREEILDNVQKEITVFLSSLLSGSVPFEAAEEARRQVRMADEFESVSDYATNVLKMMMKLEKNGLELSPEDQTEILELHDKVTDYVSMITEAVTNETTDILSRAYTQGDSVTYLMKECRRNHLERLSKSELPPLKILVYTDMLNAYRRMGDHVLNIAETLSGEK